jgi:phenylalanyl-tRNA synthetase beta chain
MKISLNWIKEYADIDISIDELTQKIGAQLGEIEEVVHLGKQYEGIVVAKVIECIDHPNADRLKVCKIDDGKTAKNVDRDKDGLVKVVCGAPNVRGGMLVAWLPPGATVPATFDKDPFVLEQREVRGEVSNGMLASANELAINDDHNGLLEIEKEAKPGEKFSEVYGLDDYIIDIENKMFTHRPDCFGLLGIAREIAGIQHKKFESPKWYLEPAKNSGQQNSGAELPLGVKNEIPKLAPRFMAVAISDVSVHPSTAYNQTYLSKVGIRPVNNIVDLTNYMMYLTGQPMHAYDYDKVKAKSGKTPTLVVRQPKKGEKLKVLGGKTIEPKPEDIMIATDKELIGFGGVIGGADTEVDENTTNIILECANFDLYTIRRTSMAHGLFTDAVTRFSKGQSSLQTDRVLAKALELMVAGSEAKQAGPVIDNNHLGKTKTARGVTSGQPINMRVDFINKRLGLKLSAEQIAKLLRNVEFDVKIRSMELSLKAPFWRTDIEIPEDVVEEVGRLYGYDHLPLELPGKKMTPSVIDEELQTKQRVRSKLASLGGNELLNYSFVHGNLLDKTGQDKSLAFQVKNALSPDLQYYRLSLTPSLLEKVAPNLKAGYDSFALFEIGKVHAKSETGEDGLPVELGRVGLVVASGKKSSINADYYLAKHYLKQLYPKSAELACQPLGDTVLDKHKAASQMLAPYEQKRSAVVFVDGKVVGVVGEFKPEVSDKLKLPGKTAGFEVFLSSLSGPRTSGYQPISKYPHVEQDISLRTDAKKSHAEIKMALVESLEKFSPQDVAIEVSCIDIFQKEESRKQTAFRVRASSHERTLTTKVVSLMLDKTAEELQTKIKAEQV